MNIMMPNVPTVKETGLTGVNPSAWYGVFVTRRDASRHCCEAVNGRAQDRGRSGTEGKI